MSSILGFLAALFWGLLLLSTLVFIHEAGHYLAARAFGVRVTEFMLGLPCRWSLSFKSKKVGTRIGVTPVLLGGYNRISGMEPMGADVAARVLMCVQRHGRVESAQVARELGVDEGEVVSALAGLSEWASVQPYYNPELGEEPGQKTYPAAFETVARDASLLTEFDRGHDLAAEGSTVAGEPRVPGCSAEEFFAQERSHTYLGLGLLKRLAVLLAGPAMNIAFAFIVVTGAFMVSGVSTASNEPVVGAVGEGTVAASCGLQAGDRVVEVGAAEVGTWSDFTSAMRPYLDAGQDFSLTIERDGRRQALEVDLPDGQATDKLGVISQTVLYHPNPLEAARLTVAYAQMVCNYAFRLLIPQQTMQILDQSTSVVGISVMASQAASAGVSDFVLLAASISMSLGFMNLLPIPPLDGGKIVIELIQAAFRRELSIKAQSYITYVGLAFFLFVFVVVLKNDIVRFVIG